MRHHFYLLTRLFLLFVAGAAGQVHAQAALPDYTLHAGDQLSVNVWKEVDLVQTLVVRPDGKFSFPLAGEIQATGRTVTQVQAEIETKLKKYIPEPVVTVTVTGIGGNVVYVIGQVNKPGAIVMNPQLMVLQALSLSGGTTPFAATNDIIILRRVGGTQKVLPFKYSEVTRGRGLEQNIFLESGDVVIVP